MAQVLQNVRVGVRGLRRTPGFALTAILTLAVGIGLATAVFTVAWRRYFGGDPRVVGRHLIMHETGVAHTIVGALPLGLDYPRGTDFWAPVVPNSGPLGDHPVYAELDVLGRLHPGASAADARAELTTYFQRPDASEWQRGVHGVVHPLTNAILGDVRLALLAFGISAGLLLLITCINVAGLLVVHGLARVREIAVRSALGAGRGHIIGQLVTESAICLSSK